MILVTGASGLVGSQVCRDLIRDGIAFKALKRESSIIPDGLQDVQWVDGDIRDPIAVKEALQGIDTIIHAAAIISFYRKEYDQMLDVNVNGTANMINCALDSGVKRFIHISSVAALGRTVNSGVISEGAKWSRSTQNTGYAETKHLAELEVWRGEQEGLSAVILNPSVILGPGKIDSGSVQLFKYAWDQGTFYPPGAFNYIDLRDLTKIILSLTGQGSESTGRFIINAGKIDYKEFFTKTASIWNRKPPRMVLKPWIERLALFGSWIGSSLTGKKPLITRESIRLSRMTYDYDNSKIKELMSFDFTPLEDTIAWTCKELETQLAKN